MNEYVMLKLVIGPIQRVCWCVVEDIKIDAGVRGPIPGQVKSNTVSPTQRYSSQLRCAAQALSRGDGCMDPATRQIFRRDTANIMVI